MYKIYNSLRYGEVKLLLLVHELGAEQAEAEAGHCQESGEDGEGDDRDGDGDGDHGDVDGDHGDVDEDHGNEDNGDGDHGEWR